MPELFEEFANSLYSFAPLPMRQVISQAAFILIVGGTAVFLAVRLRLLHWIAGKDYKLEIERLRFQLGETERNRHDADTRANGLLAENKRLCEIRDGLDSKCTEISDQVDELRQKLSMIAEADGRVWTLAPRLECPTFLHRDDRRARIVAFANMKGGVGKTTLTANLGASLAQQGYRVLLIDLDHQHSLSDLCFRERHRQQLINSGRLIERILDQAVTEPADLRICIEPVAVCENLHCIACDEGLITIEDRLQARWLLDPEKCDVRFLLRSALHRTEILNDYDFVLLDCPPRLTTGMVNALAAADFVTIPVKLDQLSLNAVPRMINWVYSFKKESEICPHLQLLGVIANETHYRTGFTEAEQSSWSRLKQKAMDRWHAHVHLFERPIPRNRAFRQAAQENGFAAILPEMDAVFRDLTEEFLNRTPHHARITTHRVS